MNNKLILKELFYFTTISLFVFILLEIISPNFVLAYFNLNLLLIFWLILAIIQVVISEK